MIRYLIRLVLFACAIYFVFPLIPGVQFHGNFGHALLTGAAFALCGWLLEIAAIALSAILTVGTLGMALFILIPAWFLGFWLIPVVALRMVADLMPSILSISGWLPAIGGGLIMLAIGIATSGDTHKNVRTKKNASAIA